MSVELGAFLGFVVALLVIGLYYVIDGRLRGGRREAAKEALREADIDKPAGEIVYQALAKIATADYESDTAIRLGVAQVLHQARPQR
jgi:hypothetical protein